MSQVGRHPVESLGDRLRNHSKRLLALERRPLRELSSTALSVIAVATAADIPQHTGSAVYVIADGTVSHEGVTHTLAQWQAMHGP